MGKKIIAILLICMCALSIRTVNVSAAASATTSVEGGSVEVGEEITVVVKISSKQSLGTFNLYVSYDSEKLKFSDSNSGDYNGGGGQVKIVGGADTSEEKSASYKLKFIANKGGTSKISVSGSAYYFDESAGEVVDMEVKSSSASVKAKAPVVASKDSTLSSLDIQSEAAGGKTTKVKLDPEFSPDVTEYHTTLTYDVNKLIVAANLSDPKAILATSGTRIDLGDNTTKIVVTAEDGSTTEYIIYSVKTTDLPEEESESDSEETTTKPDKATDNIYVDSMEKYIIIDLNGVEIPEGFEESTYTYDDKTVNVARGISKNLVLMYMADDEELTNAAFYIYDTENDSFYKMTNIQTDKKLYTIIKTPKDLKVPEGFTKKKVKIDGTNVDSWLLEGNDEFYLVYAMNWEGTTGLYVYDRAEGSMQRYIAAVAGADSEETEDSQIAEGSNEEIESLYSTIDSLKKDYKKDRDLKWKIIVALAVVSAILIILSSVLLMKMKDVEIVEEDEDEDYESDEDESETDDTPKELKLDMAVQANEMSSGALAANIEDIVKEELGEMPEENTQEEQKEADSSEKSNISEPVEYNVEPEFIQPAEMKIVDPKVFEQIVGAHENVKEETDEVKPEDKVEQKDESTDEEFTVNGGFEVENKKSKKNKKKNSAPKNESVVEDEDDDFEIEFVDMDDDIK